MTETAIFKDSDADRHHRAKWVASRALIYGILILWAIICLFPIYWTLTTSFKMAPNVMKGNLVPWWDFDPSWLGFRSLGLSPDTIGSESTVRDEFMKRFWNSAVTALASSTLAVILGSLAAYGLSRFSYKFGYMRNDDISFFFLSQLILPPVVLALPFLSSTRNWRSWTRPSASSCFTP
jgi:multiple sugar transport system permease protein